MSELFTYIELGTRHILDLSAYDHLLFVALMAVGSSPRDWRVLLVQVSGFTVGHSISLVLTLLLGTPFPAQYIEVGILLTIAFLALQRLWQLSKSKQLKPNEHLALTTSFGMIHGCGFSGYLATMLMSKDQLLVPLFGFNLGIELAQLVILALVLAVLWTARKLKVGQWDGSTILGTGLACFALLFSISGIASSL